jgi:ABC-type transport system substrate-binding protein
MLCALMPFLVAPTGVEPVSTGVSRQGDGWTAAGPYIDRVIFQVITGPDVQVAALIAGDIDCLADNVEASYIDELSANPNIEVTQTERLGFGFMAINCQRYPWTFPEFRRALAFAADKYEVATIMWEGLGFALDIPVPASCGVWHNDATTPDYKDPQVAAAVAELASAGFVDLDGDGYVEAPNGDQINFRPMYSIEAPQWGAAMTSQQPYWDLAGIRVTPMPVAFNTLLDIVYTIPRNYDGANYAFGVSPNPLALQNFIIDEIANPEGNMLNWANYDYDAEVDTMMTSGDYNTVLEAAHEAQQIFAENVPMLVWYSNWEVNAHRTDKFEGFSGIPGWGMGPMNRWTPRKVKLKEGQPDRDPATGCGGTFRTIISSAMDSQNPLTSTSVYGGYPLAQVYSSLTGMNDDDHQPTKDNGGLAYDWTSEEIDIGGDPGSPGVKYTYTLYDNATWHDLGGAAGGFVTADDVEFSYNYIFDNNIPTFSTGIPYLNSCRAVDDTHFELITNGRSYWAFDLTRGWTILPQHIWEGIVSPVTFTNPLPVGCGPFSWYRRIEGEYVELHFWENYHRGIPGHEEADVADVGSYLPIYIIVGVVVIIVVLLGSVWYLRRK